MKESKQRHGMDSDQLEGGGAMELGGEGGEMIAKPAVETSRAGRRARLRGFQS